MALLRLISIKWIHGQVKGAYCAPLPLHSSLKYVLFTNREFFFFCFCLGPKHNGQTNPKSSINYVFKAIPSLRPNTQEAQ